MHRTGVRYRSARHDRPGCRRDGSLESMPELALLDHDTVLAAVSPAAAIEATRDGVPAPPLRRVGHAGEGLPRQPAVRRLSRDAGARRRPRAAEVGHLVSGQSGARPADGQRRRLPVRRAHRRAAGDPRRARRHGAAHRRRRGRRRAGAGARGRAHRGHRRLRAARRLDGALPRRRRLRGGRLLRPARGGRRRAGRGARLVRVGDLPAALACDIVNCITPGSAIVVERDDLAAGPAPEHARRRRLGQGRGEHRRRRRLRAVLRRVGAGLARRRAGRRGGRGPRRRASRSRRSARCSPATRRAAAARTPRRSSTPRAWRSRTSPSARRCGRRRPGGAAAPSRCSRWPVRLARVRAWPSVVRARLRRGSVANDGIVRGRQLRVQSETWTSSPRRDRGAVRYRTGCETVSAPRQSSCAAKRSASP